MNNKSIKNIKTELVSNIKNLEYIRNANASVFIQSKTLEKELEDAVRVEPGFAVVVQFSDLELQYEDNITTGNIPLAKITFDVHFYHNLENDDYYPEEPDELLGALADLHGTEQKTSEGKIFYCFLQKNPITTGVIYPYFLQTISLNLIVLDL